MSLTSIAPPDALQFGGMPTTPELLARTHDGHRDGLVEVLTERYPCLYRMAYALTGNDAAAAGVVRLVLRQSVRASRRWNSPADVTRWFIHHSLLTIRRVASGRTVDLVHDPLIRSGNAANHAYYPMFVGALRALSMQQREAFMLYHGERLDERGIGVAMDCSMQAASNHLREATHVLAAYGGNMFRSLTDQFIETYDRLAPPTEMIAPAIRSDLRRRSFWGRIAANIAAHPAMQPPTAAGVVDLESRSDAAMVMALIWFEFVVLLLLLLAGFVLTIVTLPGTWLMCAALAGYAVLTRAHHLMTWKPIALLLVLATAAEIIDTVGSGAGAKKAGASKLAMFGAVVGGIIGAIFLSFIPPFPLGTIAGACGGCFVGAAAIELLVRKDVGQSLRVGFYAARGRLMGIISKIALALVMMVVGAWVALPFRARIPKPSPPIVQTTQPA